MAVRAASSGPPHLERGTDTMDGDRVPDGASTRFPALFRPGNRAPRARRVWSVAVAVLLAAVLVLTAIGYIPDRFYRLQAVPDYALPATLGAVAVLYAALAPWLSRLRAWLWVPLATALVSLAALLSVTVAFLTGWTDETPTGTTAVSPDGRYEAVEFEFLNVIDPSCRVIVRERGGLLSRQVEVWRQIDAPCPARIEFVEETRLRIVEAEVPGRDSPPSVTVSIDPETMTTPTGADGGDDYDGEGDYGG